MSDISKIKLPDNVVYNVKDSAAATYKGTLGQGGTITTLPFDSTVKKGDFYQVIEPSSYACEYETVGGRVIYGYIQAIAGDIFICNSITPVSWDLLATGTPIMTKTLKSDAGVLTSVADREYVVGVDSIGVLSVNVPWLSNYYGTCSTAVDEANKVVVCPEFDSLSTGLTIQVKFTNGNTASSPTLNVNSTGAVNIYMNGTTAPTSTYRSWTAGSIISFTYDGTGWIMNDVSAPSLSSYYTASEVQNYCKNNTFFLGSAKTLSSGTDLNTMRTAGTFTMSNSGSTCLNRPDDSATFKIYVGYDGNTSANIEQIYNTYKSPKEYRRHSTGTTTWSDWKLVNDDLSLYTKNSDFQSATNVIATLIDRGAKNLVKLGKYTITSRDLTITADPTDGSITINGTSSNTDSAVLIWNLEVGGTVSTAVQQTKQLKNGTYIVKAIDPQARIDLRVHGFDSNPSSSTYIGGAGSTDAQITIDNTYTYNMICINIGAQKTFNNEKFYPMICTLDDHEITSTFEPYAPTNKELYDTMNSFFSIGEEIPDNSDLNDYKIPGKYFVQDSSHASTINNIPLGGSAFILNVTFLQYKDYFRQEYIKQNQPEAIYVRHYRGSSTGWTSWYKFEGTPVT